MRDSQSLATLTDPRLLQDRLDEALRGVRGKHVVVAVVHENRSAYASAIDDSTPPEELSQMRIPTGCITKLFTAALVRRAVADGHFALDSRAFDLLTSCPAPHSSSSHITIKDLLEHRHGLDGTAMQVSPTCEDGRIDAVRLCAELARVAPLSDPGQLYDYSNVGPWLAAAVLEQCIGLPFRMLLQTQLFEPLGIRSAVALDAANGGAATTVCPSMGGALAVSLADMVRFVRHHFAGHPHFPNVSTGATDVVPLAGWNPSVQGVRLGWMHYGSSWLGHNSVWLRASTLLRINPDRGIAVILAANENWAPTLAARMFSELLPEFALRRMPRRLSPDDLEERDLTHYTGLYEVARSYIHIKQATRGNLALLGYRRNNGVVEPEPCITAALHSAQHDVFFAQPPTVTFQFVQFLSRSANQFKYLWNGRNIWQRIAAG